MGIKEPLAIWDYPKKSTVDKESPALTHYIHHAPPKQEKTDNHFNPDAAWLRTVNRLGAKSVYTNYTIQTGAAKRRNRVTTASMSEDIYDRQPAEAFFGDAKLVHPKRVEPAK